MTSGSCKGFRTKTLCLYSALTEWAGVNVVIGRRRGKEVCKLDKCLLTETGGGTNHSESEE